MSSLSPVPQITSVAQSHSDVERKDNILKIDNISDLTKALQEAKISTDKWVKSVSNLLEEIKKGEAVLTIVNGELVRKIEVVSIRCLYINEAGEKFKLVEDRQEFKSGVIRQRDNEYIAEKLAPNETPLEAAFRGLREELQVSGDNLPLKEIPEDYRENIKNSPSYEGLKGIYKEYWFDLQMPEDKFNKDGYKEVQAEKTNYFIWKKV